MNMLQTIIPRSDQLNADDLINGPIVIKITGVNVAMSEQPVTISYVGDNGHPYKPGKSMRRVLVTMWGADATAYVGRSLELYRDEKVMFGGFATGGIRISRMSDIPGEKTMALTATKAVRKPFTVKPLQIAPERDLIKEADEAAGKGTAAYVAFWKTLNKDQAAKLLPDHEARKATAAAVTPPAEPTKAEEA